VFGMLPKNMQNSSMLFPPQSVLIRCEMVKDLGDATAFWDRAWTEIKVLNNS